MVMCNVSGVFPEAPVSVMVHFFHVDRKQIPFTSFGISLILSPPPDSPRQSSHPDVLSQQFPPAPAFTTAALPSSRLDLGRRLTTLQAAPTTMSQLQFQCPASPMMAASAPMQPQPCYSIPCPSGTLPSESASQPIRSSALPAGSATPYNAGLFHAFVVIGATVKFFFFFV